MNRVKKQESQNTSSFWPGRLTLVYVTTTGTRQPVPPSPLPPIHFTQPGISLSRQYLKRWRAINRKYRARCINMYVRRRREARRESSTDRPPWWRTARRERLPRSRELGISRPRCSSCISSRTYCVQRIESHGVRNIWTTRTLYARYVKVYSWSCRTRFY